jgi:hypothetical protein
VYKREALCFPLPGEFANLTAAKGGPSTQPSRSQPAPPRGKHQNTRLRHELGRVNDGVGDVLAFLVQHRHGFQITDMTQLISSLDAIYVAVTMMLDPGLEGQFSGGLSSRPEDRDMDDAMIRDINDRLADICLRRDPAGEWDGYQPATGRHPIYALADNDQLDSLRTCITVLTAILVPARSCT